MIDLNIFQKESKIAGVATDFDGTISAISQRQSQAKIDPQAKKLLRQLRQKYKVVSIISGRQVMKLAKLVDLEGLFYVGNHGAEFLSNNNYWVDEEAKKIAPLLDEIYQKLLIYKHEFELDYKKYSLSIHYRRHAEPKQAEKQLQGLLSKYINPDLRIQRGRKVFDLSAKHINKGNAVDYLINKHNLKYFLYIGDDRTDIDAFDKMTELKKQGITTVKIALASNESPKDLVTKSDLKLNSIKELLDLFQRLL